MSLHTLPAILYQAALHAGTPEVQVTGTAGPVRALHFLRHPDTPATTRLLISRTVADPQTRAVRQYGARALQDTEGRLLPDATTLCGLGGQPLSLHTADGDTTLTLPDAAGRPLWRMNAQGTISTVTYAKADAGGRPLSLSETAAGADTRTREQYTYVPLDDMAARDRNLAGALCARRDNAGLSETQTLSLTGATLRSRERLLKTEAGLPDWPASDADLESEAGGLTVSATYDATGAPLVQTNAAGVTIVTAYDISGAVRETCLRYRVTPDAPETEIVTLKDMLYRADGVVLSQTAGNGVTDTYEYDPRSQRLIRHLTQRPADHFLGALVITDLLYTFDPAGNIRSLIDAAAQTTWHTNQMTDGTRTYTYDTLYRLTQASGRERKPVNPDDLSAGYIWSPYTERYTYDDGDNLTKTAHIGGSGNRTVTMTVAAGSNRALTADSGSSPETGFLPGGLQKALADGRALSWYADGQLQQINPVLREDRAADDTERYRYRDRGTRVQKLRTTAVSGGTQMHTTTYLGGAETRQRRNPAGALALDVVISKGGGMRLIQDRLTGETYLRWSFNDHLNSSGGETDENGNITSREEYLPFGGSAGSDEEASEITDRTRRYSGKERDATGLLYYGWRYYQPETGRWLSADPGGLIDGVNLFRFCSNMPSCRIDHNGKNDDDVNELLKLNFETLVLPRIESRTEADQQAAENQLSKVFNLHGEALGEVRDKIIEYLWLAPRSINVKASTLGNFTDNYIKNTFATGTRLENQTYANLRSNRNRVLIDYERASPALQLHHQPLTLYLMDPPNPDSPAGHPTHGSIQLQSLKPNRGGAPLEDFGHSALFLESSSQAYLTYTPQDSMFVYVLNKNIDGAPSLEDTMAVTKNMFPLIRYAHLAQLKYIYNVAVEGSTEPLPMHPYMEWQAHARLTLGKDIKLLTIAENEKTTSFLYGENKVAGQFAKKHNLMLRNQEQVNS